MVYVVKRNSFRFLLSFAFNLFCFQNQMYNGPAKGTVALTFDDGPNPVYTREILAILKKYNIKATLFMVGVNAKKYPDVVKEVYEQGHAVDSHSLTHPMLTKLNDAALRKEIATPQIIIFDIISTKPVCLRYPFGASNDRVRAAIRCRRYGTVLWVGIRLIINRPGTDKIVSWV